MSVPAQQPKDDRRNSIRCQCSLMASSDPSQEAHEWSGKVEEISEHGLRLLLSRRFEAGTILKVVLRRSDGGFLSSLQARVMHVTNRDDQFQHGCEIVPETGS
ncbi:MAG: PilZ domain-containing protein [Gemmataceae bacterium]